MKKVYNNFLVLGIIIAIVELLSIVGNIYSKNYSISPLLIGLSFANFYIYYQQDKSKKKNKYLTTVEKVILILSYIAIAIVTVSAIGTFIYNIK